MSADTPGTKRVPTGIAALEQLRVLVDEDGRSINQIAADGGIDRVHLYAVLSGRRKNPSVDTIARILASLGRSWADLDV